MITRKPRKVPWWNKKLSGLKAKTKNLFNIATIHDTGTLIRRPSPIIIKKLGKPEKSSRRRYCHEISDVPGCAILVKFMAKQATNRVGSIKLPDGQYTQTEREALKELFRVYFPNAMLTNDSND
jgi:hypothetical protein